MTLNTHAVENAEIRRPDILTEALKVIVHKLLSLIALALSASASFAEQATTEPDAIVIMKSEGAYLNILPNGFAKAGFGALPHCAEMPAGTFDFTELLQTDLNEQMIIKNEKRDASVSYIAVGFSRNSAATLYHFDNRELIVHLFEHAERHARMINGDVTCPFAAE